MLREVLGIANKRFHDTIIGLIKRKRLSIELDGKKPIEMKVAKIDELAM